MATIMRACLEEEHFAKLVRGKTVALITAGGNKIEICLADIGWDRMYYQIEGAMREQGHE
jgi:hypothetical protein